VCAGQVGAGDIYEHMRAAHGGISVEPLLQHEEL
jgi:hypothetical protein